MNTFLTGLSIGFAYVAPIGLQNMFVINSALSQTKKRAYLTALIIIFFDVTLALACFFGIGAIMQQSKWLELIILAIGSVVVIYIGYGLLRSKGELDTSKDMNMTIPKLIATACVVTWFNPQAIIDGSMLIGASSAAVPAGETFIFIIGMNIASVLWFLGLTTIITLFSNKITDKVLRIINIVCGLVIIFYGMKLFVNFVTLILPYIK